MSRSSVHTLAPTEHNTTSQTMDLPGKDVFLAARLMPISVKDSKLLCTICWQPFTSPVQTPCKHIFCAECLVKWLTKVNSCPSDRTEFFRKDAATSKDNAASGDNLLTRQNERSRVYGWPEGIEPFLGNDGGFGLGTDDDLLDMSETDIAVRGKVICWMYFFDLWISDSVGDNEHLQDCDPNYIIHCDSTTLRSIVLAAIQRLASAPADNTAMHGLCRAEWVRVYCRISERLRYKTISPPKVSTLKNILVNLLEPWKYATSEPDFSRRTPGVVLNDEVRRFGADLQVLIRWVVWAAADEHARYEIEPEANISPEVAERMVRVGSKLRP
ncbi:hypothetical protein DOTSEDRAFT_75189 [Dothistroma septosporum NZE10]|uniref:RING-type domain-containing protein n=1 Tax=Dothistroma septosporum (strain NZE10 / CBS 128990) TaxID=675120 RepID=M2YKM4_DOTSN|nr:hypothetical protein DOTSEDRAFT_75189 [Dothistroma septosporum NZE10]